MRRKAFERVIDAFERQALRVRHTGDGQASAQAPGHSRSDLSVSITAIDGRVLLWSHSDSVEEVMDSLGLTMSDLFDDPKGVQYDYPDGRRVSRSPAKRFFQTGNTKGSQLYRADRLAAASTVFFVEGEQDVHAVESQGAVATCTAMGAGKAHKFDLSPLYGKTVLIVRDMDEPGLEHAAQVAKLLEGRAEVHLVEPVVGKDAADHIAAGHGVGEFVTAPIPEATDPEFEQAVEQELAYRRMKQEALRREREAEAALSTARLEPKTLGQILDLTFEQQWVVPGIFEPGDRLIITGMEGGGKSVFLRQVSIMAAAGVDPFSLAPIDPVKVLVIDTENSERQWSRMAKYVTSLAESAGQRSPKDHVIVAAGASLDLSKPGDVNQIHKLIDEHQPGIVQIGPLYKLVGREITTDTEAAPLIKTLDSFRERGVVLTMEAHSGSAGKSAGSLRPIGSSAFLRWPEFGRGLLPTEENPEFVDFVKWRGDREERSWPSGFRRGWQGELPWVPLRGDQDEY